MTRNRPLFGALALVTAACSPAAAPAPKMSASADVRLSPSGASMTSAEIHMRLLTPASDALYAVESAPPTSADGWTAAQTAADKLTEGAVLMQSVPQPAKPDDWVRMSKAVEIAARKSAEAIRARNVDAISAANGAYTAQCEDCHLAFRDAGGGMMSKPDR